MIPHDPRFYITDQISRTSTLLDHSAHTHTQHIYALHMHQLLGPSEFLNFVENITRLSLFLNLFRSGYMGDYINPPVNFQISIIFVK